MIRLRRKLDTETHALGKVDGITILCRPKCINTFCKHGHNCSRRKGGFRFHNFQVRLRRKLGFSLPISLYSRRNNLSGTPLCSAKLPRQHSCTDCEFGYDFWTCNNVQKIKDVQDGVALQSDYSECKCAYFKLSKYGDSWDRQTGEHR